MVSILEGKTFKQMRNSDGSPQGVFAPGVLAEGAGVPVVEANLGASPQDVAKELNGEVISDEKLRTMRRVYPATKIELLAYLGGGQYVARRGNPKGDPVDHRAVEAVAYSLFHRQAVILEMLEGGQNLEDLISYVTEGLEKNVSSLGTRAAERLRSTKRTVDALRQARGKA